VISAHTAVRFLCA